MSRKISFATGEYYHVYNRGNGGRLVFPEVSDKNRFQKLLYLCNDIEPFDYFELSLRGKDVFKLKRNDTLVDVGAYCVMYSHYHLLLHEKVESGISRFMQKLGTATAMYFNTKYKNSGSIFEGPFRAKHADSDRYLEYLFAYIHINPVEHLEKDWKDNGLKNLLVAKNYLHKYAHSSFPDYVNNFTRPEALIINPTSFPEYFRNKTDVEEYHDIWLNYEQ